MLGILYGILGLIFIPFFLLAALIGSRAGVPAFFGDFFVLLMSVLYAFIGFIGGIIAGALCNVIAKWTGGLEFAVGGVVPAA